MHHEEIFFVIKFLLIFQDRKRIHKDSAALSHALIVVLLAPLFQAVESSM